MAGRGAGRDGGLQVPGGVGVSMFLSSSATNAPYTVTIDDVVLRPASRTGP